MPIYYNVNRTTDVLIYAGVCNDCFMLVILHNYMKMFMLNLQTRTTKKRNEYKYDFSQTFCILHGAENGSRVCIIRPV